MSLYFAAPEFPLSLPFSTPAGEVTEPLSGDFEASQPAESLPQTEGGPPKLGEVTLMNAARANAVLRNEGKTPPLLPHYGPIETIRTGQAIQLVSLLKPF